MSPSAQLGKKLSDATWFAEYSALNPEHSIAISDLKSCLWLFNNKLPIANYQSSIINRDFLSDGTPLAPPLRPAQQLEREECISHQNSLFHHDRSITNKKGRNPQNWDSGLVVPVPNFSRLARSHNFWQSTFHVLESTLYRRSRPDCSSTESQYDQPIRNGSSAPTKDRPSDRFGQYDNKEASVDPDGIVTSTEKCRKYVQRRTAGSSALPSADSGRSWQK